MPVQDDAQIGADILGWKMTITGVGHCRQVGCPESGIDDAVIRLASAGYKVRQLPAMHAHLPAAILHGLCVGACRPMHALHASKGLAHATEECMQCTD